MKNTLALLLITFLMGTCLNAQVKIGDNPQNIDPSSVLELESTDKVLVITRVTTAQMNTISPIQGALCYNTELQAVHFYDGTQWVNIGSGGGTGEALTADPIVNDVSTIVITPTAAGDNLEVAPNSISSLQIIDGGINGIDIQDGSIGPGKLQNNSVTEEKLSENSVGAFALDNDNISVSAFNNDVGYITAGDLDSSVSADANNAIVAGSDGGAFYDDTNLMNDVIDNATAIAADDDQSSANEIQNLELNGTILGLSLTVGTVDLGPIVSAGGSDDQNLTLNGNIIEIEDGNTIDLTPILGSGGSTEQVDGTTLTGIGTAGDPFKIEPGTSGQVLTTVGTDVVWATVTPGGGTTEVVDNATLTGVGTAGDPFKIEPSLTVGQYLRTTATGVVWDDVAGGGNQNLSQVLGQGTDGGAALIKNILDPVDPQDAATRAYVDATVASGGSLQDGRILLGGTGDIPQQVAISGDATLANDGALTIANDVVTTIKILDANVTAAKLEPGGNDQILRTASDGLSVAWVDLPTGAASFVDATLTGDGTSAATALGIAPAIALPTPAAQMLITTDAGVIDWAQISGTENSVFYAGPDGLPTTADENANPRDDRGFFWDPNGRDLGGTFQFGALYLGLEPGNAQSNAAKVHIADNFPGLTYSLHLQNFNDFSPDRTTGILFSTVDNGAYGKGSLIFDTQGTNGIGDFHFLQNNTANTNLPTIADKAFTVKNNKDIVIYGGIEIDGDGLGTAGEVLTSTGTGVEWAVSGGSTTVVSADMPNSIAIGTDGGALYDDSTLVALVAANTAANSSDTDQDPNNEIELPTGGSSGQVLSLDASLNPVWSAGVGTTNNLATDNQIQDAEDRTYNLNNQNLVFTGDGNIGIGNSANPPSNKLHVAGAIRAEGIRNSPGTLNSVAYSFHLDPDTGINNTGADELTFVVGALSAMIIADEGTTDSEILLNGSLELTEQLLDETGNTGASGQVLTSTNTGTEWKNPAVLAMGKANGAVSINVNGVTVGGPGGGINTVTFNTPMPDPNYIIQLAVEGDFRIYITNQTANGFTVETFDNTSAMLDVATWHFTILDF